jgi:preprotein translocase subunit SecE
MAKSVTVEQGGGSRRDQGLAEDKLQSLKSWNQRTVDFFHDVRSEMRKVTTPTRDQVQSTTAVVIVAVFVFAFYFWVVDLFLRFSIDKLLYRFSHH